MNCFEGLYYWKLPCTLWHHNQGRKHINCGGRYLLTIISHPRFRVGGIELPMFLWDIHILKKSKNGLEFSNYDMDLWKIWPEWSSLQARINIVFWSSWGGGARPRDLPPQTPPPRVWGLDPNPFFFHLWYYSPLGRERRLFLRIYKSPWSKLTSAVMSIRRKILFLELFEPNNLNEWAALRSKVCKGRFCNLYRKGSK